MAFSGSTVLRNTGSIAVQAAGAANRSRSVRRRRMASARAVGIGDELPWVEVDGGQMVQLVRVWEAGDLGGPARRRGGHFQMIEQSAAADHGLAAGEIG